MWPRKKSLPERTSSMNLIQTSALCQWLGSLVSCTLRCNSILHGWDSAPLAKALHADTTRRPLLETGRVRHVHRVHRRTVQLSFTGCSRFFDSDLAMLVEHLPVSLEVATRVFGSLLAGAAPGSRLHRSHVAGFSGTAQQVPELGAP